MDKLRSYSNDWRNAQDDTMKKFTYEEGKAPYIR